MNTRNTWRAWVMGIAAAAVVLWVGWSSHMLVDIDKRLAVIEANRFHSEDGHALRAELTEHEQEPWHEPMNQCVAGIEESLRRIERLLEQLRREAMAGE
jgi:hypothetical protein